MADEILETKIYSLSAAVGHTLFFSLFFIFLLSVLKKKHFAYYILQDATPFVL